MVRRLFLPLAMILAAIADLAFVGPAVAFSTAPTSSVETIRRTPVDQAGWNARKMIAALPNGIRLAYVEAGNPAGPPLVLLHGYTDTSRAWTMLVPYLSHYRLLIPDQRGHGASTVPECCYALADFANDARLFMDALEIERAAVAGHSLGSMVAQRFAADHPGRVSKLVLLGSTAIAPLDRDHWLYRAVFEAQGRMVDRPEFLAQWSPAASPTPVDPVFTRYADAETAAIAPVVWTSVIRELVDLPIARHAADVTAPVVVLSAEKDIFFDARHHEALLDAYPGSRSRIFAGLGHDFIKERPEVVGPALAALLDEPR